MVIQLSKINSVLTSVKGITDLSSVVEATNIAFNKQAASKTTEIGKAVGALVGGIESLTQEVENAFDLDNLVSGVSIAGVTRNAEGVEADLVREVSGKGSIDLITGNSTASADGFLDDIISGGSPEAIASSLQKVTGKNPKQLSSVLTSLSSSELSSYVVDGITSNIPKEFNSIISIASNSLDNLLGSKSSSYLQDLVEKQTRDFENTVQSVVDIELDQNELDAAYNYVIDGDYYLGFKIVFQYIDKPEDFLITTGTIAIEDWNEETTVAYNKVVSAEEIFNSIKLETYDSVDTLDGIVRNNLIKVNDIGISGTNFEYVKSGEELEAMFRNINRTPNKAVAGITVHWTASFNNQDLSANDIDVLHKSLGYSEIGYHLIIRRDGSLQIGRTLDSVGQHDDNHNQTFLGVAFVGGMNVSSVNAVKPYWKYETVDSLTNAQWKTYEILMENFQKVFPYALVAGHNATSEEEYPDPGFDVIGYSESKFNHINAIPEGDPLWFSEITVEDIKNYVS